jgi:hypothetical protein
LQKHLQSILNQTISADQLGCIKALSTFSNIRSTIDIIAHTKEKNTIKRSLAQSENRNMAALAVQKSYLLCRKSKSCIHT